MRFQLFDLANGSSRRFYRDVTGSATYTVTWNPPVKGAAATPEAMAAGRPRATLRQPSPFLR